MAHTCNTNIQKIKSMIDLFRQVLCWSKPICLLYLSWLAYLTCYHCYVTMRYSNNLKLKTNSYQSHHTCTTLTKVTMSSNSNVSLMGEDISQKITMNYFSCLYDHKQVDYFLCVYCSRKKSQASDILQAQFQLNQKS